MLSDNRYSILYRSSSYHRINADRDLSTSSKFLWFIVNALINYIGNMLSRKSRSPKYRLNHSGTVKLLSELPSPSRFLSNYFWKSLDWELIETELGQINIFDIGCGDGNYYEKFSEYSKGRVKRYWGIDVEEHPNWKSVEQQGEGVGFEKVDMESDISRFMPKGTNFIVSQSALEHFEEDLIVFRNLRRYTDQLTNSVIQIHLVPSEACLYLYWLHGIRQYSTWTLKRIGKLFATNSYWEILGLGGASSNRVHWQYITPLPFKLKTDSRQRLSKQYRNALVKAATEDGSRSAVRYPSFYALIIHTNPETRIFDCTA